jgi:hypothetical protein
VISSNLAAPSSVGILVQRIVRAKRVHGHRVLVVRNVGRVPLGRHRRGHLRLHWNLRVNHHRLARGKYVVTLRAVKGSKKTVLARAKPVIVSIRR